MNWMSVRTVLVLSAAMATLCLYACISHENRDLERSEEHASSGTKRDTILLIDAGVGPTAGDLSAKSPPTTPVVPGTTTLTPWVDKGSVHPGYIHSAATSKFPLGDNVKVTSDSVGIVRQIGSNGVMTTFPNGFFASRPLPDSRLKSAKPLAAVGEDHAARVLAYFVSSGLPSNQVGKLNSNTIMREAGGDGAATVRTHAGYVSVIDRKLNGFRIEGSYAWAQFNDADEVVAESVWWPPIPASVMQEATALVAAATDTSPSGFRSKLPPKLQAAVGEVVIHHAPPISAGWFAEATIDFSSPDELETQSFKGTGIRVTFSPVRVGAVTVP